MEKKKEEEEKKEDIRRKETVFKIFTQISYGIPSKNWIK